MSLRFWLSILTVISVAGVVVLGLSIIATSPQIIGPVGVTVWFMILFVTASAMASLALYGAKSYLRLHSARVTRLRYAIRQGLLLSALLVGVLSLSSLRQLGLLDVILLGLVLVTIEVYVRFRWP